jgi:hypothetical protein
LTKFLVEVCAKDDLSILSGANDVNNRCVMDGNRERRSEENLQIQAAPDTGISRRGFLGLAAASIFLTHADKVSARSESRNGIPYRRLGRTQEKVSLIGLGGSHLGKQEDPQESIRIIRTGLDEGINFLDNCWDYNGGESEIRMGNALRDGYRQKAFLMSKIDGRTKTAAAAKLVNLCGAFRPTGLICCNFTK